MEEIKNKKDFVMDKDIVFSKSIRAGKRIYYLDAKKNRRGDIYLVITESKKMVSGEGENALVNYEKHKIFLHQEDFEKFTDGLLEVVRYIVDHQTVADTQQFQSIAENSSLNDEKEDDSLSLDIDFVM